MMIYLLKGRPNVGRIGCYMLDAAFELNGSVGLLFKKQIEVSYYDFKFKELS